MILLDTSVLVEHFRKKEKTNTFLYELSGNQSEFAISTISHYEILAGSNDVQTPFWEELFTTLVIFPFDVACSEQTARIYKYLKAKGRLIELADLAIAATAIAYQLPLATLNTKHFLRVEELNVISPK